jgi:hypothetical protein
MNGVLQDSPDAQPKTGQQSSPFKKPRDLHDWIDLYGRLVLAAAAALIAGWAFWFQRSQEANQTEERMQAKAIEIQRRFEAARDTRHANEAVVSTALVPMVINGNTLERRYALMTLARVAPRVLLRIAAVAEEMAVDDEQRDDVVLARQDASPRDLDAEFRLLLRAAREFLAANLNEEACAKFKLSWNKRPRTVDVEMEMDMLFEAVDGCNEPERRKSGAEVFQAAFKDIRID